MTGHGPGTVKTHTRTASGDLLREGLTDPVEWYPYGAAAAPDHPHVLGHMFSG